MFPFFGHLCHQTHKCWNVWTKTAVWRALESWRRSIGSVHAVAPETVAEPESIAHADRGSLALLPKTWRSLGGRKVQGPDGTLYEIVEKAQEAFLASQAIEQHIPAEDIAKLRGFFFSTDDVQEVLEIDGAVVTTNQ